MEDARHIADHKDQNQNNDGTDDIAADGQRLLQSGTAFVVIILIVVIIIVIPLRSRALSVIPLLRSVRTADVLHLTVRHGRCFSVCGKRCHRYEIALRIDQRLLQVLDQIACVLVSAVRILLGALQYNLFKRIGKVRRID